ncbi:hypothetical protein AOB46_06565 [Chryseobacterium indologenes]|uniref:Uncharacterized protein n=1 Tax=Chryseobacterium indologenes TaxID=253 RepID=A0A0N0ZXP2_CHRID|nr:hypothetical protein AOB46_06565 [Chryseobacterium indologenes]
MIYNFRVISFTVSVPRFRVLSLCVIDKPEDKYTENNQRKNEKSLIFLKVLLTVEYYFRR